MAFDDDLHPDDEQRRQCLQRLLTVSALTMTPVSSIQANLLKAAWWGSSPEKLDDDKSIFSLDGKVRVNNQPADLNTRIRTGDTVSTGRESEVVFVVGSDSFILRSNTQMEIKGSNFFVSALRLITGSMLSAFGTRNNKQQLTVNSATATMGVRGTGIYMEAEPDLTYLCTCYGHVGVASATDPDDTEIIVAEHHDLPKYITNKASKGTHIWPAPFKNHTDAELKVIEAIVGREVPFGIESELYKGERREY